MIGKTLGHYEVLEPLGAGGMGEVYRARDTTLKREVAIKVLPEELSADPDRLARLEREAHLLAALNHPNIATIYSLEQDEDTRFLVLELVKGESLEQRLAKGPLRTEAALDVCKQIAEALEAAHGEGIIHRDLKPANVLITPQGRAKVLDFGLAKVFEANASGGDITLSPTLTVAGTQAGVILGTAPYMSPEQVRGQQLDRRVDIWAFGCVVYEALTASRAFARETVADTLAAILEAEPNWGALPAATPPMVGALIKRCLRKEPARRLHDIADARIEIEEALIGGTDAMSAVMGAPATGEATRGIPWTLAAPIAVAIALLAALGVWVTIPSPESVAWRFHIHYPPVAAFLSTSTLGLAISPDGRWVVFNANGLLWRRAADGTVAEPINGTEGGRTPFFSPDGGSLGFWGSDGQMKSVPIAGGEPTSLGPAPERAFGASWADDGFIYFGQGGGISRVSETGGSPQVIVELQEGEQAYGPQLLPGGEWLLFTLLGDDDDSWEDASIVAQRMSGEELKRLVARGRDARYVPTGHIVYSVDGDLVAVAFDAGSMEVTGEAVPVIDGVRQSSPEGWILGLGRTGATQYAFSDSGVLVYMPFVGDPDTSRIVWADRKGRIEPLPFEPRRYFGPDLSPDEQRVALRITEEDGSRGIWILELERGGSELERGGSVVPLAMEGNNTTPRWSHDGQWVFFSSDRKGDGKYDIWKRRADGRSEAELVWDGEGDLSASLRSVAIDSDGELLLLFYDRNDLGIVRPDSDQEPKMLFSTPGVNEARGVFSPDGRFVAYASQLTGLFEVSVIELSTGENWTVSTPDRGGGHPFWSRDGKEIFFISTTQTLGILGVDVATAPFARSAPRELSSVRTRSPFAATRDGQRFLTLVEAAPGGRINVDLNWFERLKRRVPTGR